MTFKKKEAKTPVLYAHTNTHVGVCTLAPTYGLKLSQKG